MPSKDERDAAALMAAFARRTGLDSDRPGVRYLWTDAFAVCNALGLATSLGDPRYTQLALTLVDRVHHTLGRYGADDPRTGWISGLDFEQGEQHPTIGGLRIGKALPERAPFEPFDEQLEWDRDGQYFHYLTQWMHALSQVSRRTRDPRFAVWGSELADTAYRKFSVAVDGRSPRRMYWKMSVDLSRPLVASMGQHDALDGYVAALELRATREALGASGPVLSDVISGFHSMIDVDRLETADPLGIGGLLIDASRLSQIARERSLEDVALPAELLESALVGLEELADRAETDLPAEHRLAFRELGVAIGLRAAASIHGPTEPGSASSEREHAALERLGRLHAMGSRIVAFWRDPGHQTARSWLEHRDINEVMLATALTPDGFSRIRTGAE